MPRKNTEPSGVILEFFKNPSYAMSASTYGVVLAAMKELSKRKDRKAQADCELVCMAFYKRLVKAIETETISSFNGHDVFNECYKEVLKND